ncbi:MAG TPA: ankyrin repeat domain-containing protein [Caulobacteraceae bacterium]|nr:ankyrin repeat domain-containing protein [Caulobacteraceae bacterium]
MSGLRALFELIAGGEDATALSMIATDPSLAREAYRSDARRQAAHADFFPAIRHYAYDGDTALHLAAAACRPKLIEALLAKGADVHGRNRRRAGPLHYAVDGAGAAGDQAEVVRLLIAAGADPDAADASGVAPLHRAVRNRRAEAVEALLAAGADPARRNGSGSTPMRLTQVNSGKSGSGSDRAKAERQLIVGLIEHALRQT